MQLATQPVVFLLEIRQLGIGLLAGLEGMPNLRGYQGEQADVRIKGGIRRPLVEDAEGIDGARDRLADAHRDRDEGNRGTGRGHDFLERPGLVLEIRTAVDVTQGDRLPGFNHPPDHALAGAVADGFEQGIVEAVRLLDAQFLAETVEDRDETARHAEMHGHSGQHGLDGRAQVEAPVEGL